MDRGNSLRNDPEKMLIDVFVRPARRVGAERLLRTPDAALDRVRREAERALAGVINDVGVAGLRAVFEELASEFVRRGNDLGAARLKAREKLRADPTAQELLAVIDAADARFPMAPIVASIHPEGLARASLRAMSVIEAAKRARRERRWRLACQAAGLVAEGAYRMYVHKLWILCQLARGNIELKGTPPYRTACEQTSAWLSDCALLVFPDAVRIRNALHHQHFEFSSGTRLIRLWERDGWEDHVSAGDLIWLSETLLGVTRSFQSAITTYLFCALSELGVARTFTALALSRAGRLTPEHEQRIAAEVRARMDSAFAAVPPGVWQLHGAGEDRGASYFAGMARQATSPVVPQSPRLLLAPQRLGGHS